MTKIQPEELEQIRQKMIKIFYESVEISEKAPWHLGKDYYYKWIGTTKVASVCGMNLQKIRLRLKLMESKNMVKSKRNSNWIDWVVIDVPGYKQHKMVDFLTPLSLTELRKKKLEDLK